MKKRLLSLLLVLAMVVGLLPAMAMAASEAEPQTIDPYSEAVPASAMEFPIGKKWLEITDLDEIDGDGPYAIVYYGNVAKSILHCNNQVDQLTAAITESTTGGKAELTGQFAAPFTEGNISKADDGYTIKYNGYYININNNVTNGAKGSVPISDTNAQELIITKVEGGFTIGNGNGYYLSHKDVGGTATDRWFYTDTTATVLRIFKCQEMLEVRNTLADVVFKGENSDEPMDKADVGTGYFRIPGIITLPNGWLVASSDVRWASDVDNPQNIDTIVSLSKDGGLTWNWEIINYMSDWKEGVGDTHSASFIDPAILSTGYTLWVVADITPYMHGDGSYDRKYLSTKGTGYDGQTDNMLVIYDEDATLTSLPVTDPNQYSYRVNVTSSTSDMTADDAWGVSRTVYPITEADGGAESGMYVDAFFNLYETGEDGQIVPVYCIQQGDSDAYTQNNLFYAQSKWRIFPTFYLCMHKGTVDPDNGNITWDDPIYPNVRYDGQNAFFMAVCPGRGIVIPKDGAANNERLIFPVYDNDNNSPDGSSDLREWASTIYSDDGGKTWTRSKNRASQAGSSGTVKSSESQIVLLPNGRLRMYSRGESHTICYAESSDGGDTWGAYTADTPLVYCGNCMVSFINVEGTLTNTSTGKEYEHVFMASYPSEPTSGTMSGSNRFSGVVRLGYWDENENTIKWLDEIVPNDHDTSTSFVYSCLTQYKKTNGTPTDEFGWLHEENSAALIHYQSFHVNDYLNGWLFNSGSGDISLSVPLYGARTITIAGAGSSDVNTVKSSLQSQLSGSNIVSLGEVTTDEDTVVATLNGLKEGSVEFTYGETTYRITVKLPNNTVQVTLRIGDTWECPTPHTTSEIPVGQEDGAVHLNEVRESTRQISGLTLQRYEDGGFNGEPLPLENALYTAVTPTNGTGSVALKGTTETGGDVYLATKDSLANTSPSATAAYGLSFTVESSDSNHAYFSIQDTGTNKTDNGAYLYFHYNVDNPYFNRAGKTGDYTNKFQIFTNENINGTEASEVFTDYYRVTAANQITVDHQYIVAYEVTTGSESVWYVLYPSNVTGQYNHVAKFNGMVTSETITSYFLNVTAREPGVHDIMIDGVLHRFTVLDREVVDIYVDLGSAYDGVYPYDEDYSPDKVEGTSATISTIQKTYYDNVQVGSGANYNEDSTFSGGIYRIRDCLFVFSGNNEDGFDIYSAKNPNLHARTGTSGKPVKTTAGSWTISSAGNGLFYLKDSNPDDSSNRTARFLYMYNTTSSNSGTRAHRFDHTTASSAECAFSLFTRDVYTGVADDGAEPVVIDGMTDFYRVTSLDQLVDGAEYLIAREDKNNEGVDNVYLLYPSEGGDVYSYVAKVLQDGVGEHYNDPHTDYYLQAKGVELGVTTVTIGSTVYRIHVVATVTVTDDDHLTIGDFEEKQDGTEDVVITITPDQGYAVDEITVTIGEDAAVKDKDYTVAVNAQTGVATVTINAGFEDHVVVSATSKVAEEGPLPPSTFTVTAANGEHYTTSGAPTGAVGNTKDVVVTITPSQGYEVSGVTVTIGGRTAVKDTDYTVSVNAQTGAATVTIKAGFDGNVVVTATTSKVKEDETPSGPNTPSTPGTPSTPNTPNTNVTTGTTTQGGDTSTETTAKPDASASGGSASSSVSGSMGSEIVDQAEKNGSDSVVLEPNMPGNVTKADVTIPGSTLSQLSEKTEADVTVKTPAGSVTIPNEALEDLGKSGSSVTISVETKDSAASVDVKVNGRSVDRVTGGIKAAFPIEDGQVAVLVDADGSETIIKKSMVEDGTAYMVLDGTAEIKIIDNKKNFNDVQAGDWYANAVEFASSHELLTGIGNSTFSPGSDMTRAMLATVLWRLESEARPSGSITNFSDVAAGSWYDEGVAWASSAGIVQGTGANNFSPDNSITREQMVTMLYRYANSVGLDTRKRANLSTFTDGAKVSSWAKDAMEWAVAMGLFQGNGNDMIDAAGTATRAQVATVLERMVRLLVK